MTRSFPEAAGGASTLVEALARRARSQGGETAYTFLADGEEPAGDLTFAELDRKAGAVAASLSELGAGSGARALLLYPTGLDFVAGFLGCLYAGVVAVPAYPPASRRHLPRLHAIARDAEPAVVLTSSGTLPKLRATASSGGIGGGSRAASLPGLGGLPWLATDTVDVSNVWHGPLPSPEDLAFLQYTSGSTAAPKGVMVSHGNLVHNETVIRRQTGHDESTVFVGWLPLYHDMGLIGNVLQPLWLGVRSVLMSPVAFLQKPVRWLRAISRYRATTSGGPNMAYELCLRRVDAGEKAELDLSSWSLAFSGAEPVRAETLERFAEAFAECGFRREALYPCYGMAETTLMITGGRRSALPVVADLSAPALEQDRAEPAEDGGDVRRVVGCGHAGTDFEVVIADPATRRRLGEDRVGEIWVSSPSVAQGYWRQPEVTEKTFRARIEGEPDRGPFLRTGDLGFLSGGELFVTGRRKDLIILRGRNHYPQDIEATVESSHPALRPGCGVAVPFEVGGEERLVVIHELDRHAKEDPEVVSDAVRRGVAEVHQVQVHDVVLIRTGTLPKTSSGKLRRRAALEEYRAGTLTVVARSPLSSEAGAEVLGAELELDRAALLVREDPRPLLEEFLCDRVARLTRSAAAGVDPGRPLSSFGLDSLHAVELSNEIESRLGVEVPLAELVAGPSIAGLASRILSDLSDESDESDKSDLSDLPDLSEHPLSYGQQALWYLRRLAPESAAYNIRGAALLEGELSIEALRGAARLLTLRHPSLRTRFAREGEEPRARLGDEPPFAFDVRDAAGLSREELDGRLSAEAHRPFDLETGPVLRFTVFVLGPGRHLLLLVVHHIVADFWSLGILFRELGALYESSSTGKPPELEPLLVTYGDFVHWHRARIEGPEGERLRAYWHHRLSGELPALDLPADRPRPALQTFDGDSRSLSLGPGLTEALEALSASRGATLFMTLMAAFQVVLRRWSGQTDLLVGSPATLRSKPELSHLVGYFVNPIVIRGHLEKDRSLPFTGFLDQIRATTLEAFAHQDYPFPLLAEELAPAHDPSRSPLFQVMFVWQRDRLPEEEGLAAFALGEEGARLDLGRLTARSVRLPEATAQFDLSLDMALVEGKLLASLKFNTDLFDGSTAERLLGNLATLLGGVVATPEAPVAELPLLTEAERRHLVRDWNPEPAEPETACLHELFALRASRTGEAEALVSKDRRLTCRQLDRAANRLAHRLRALGVGPEVPVGLCVERGPEMIVGLLGILKAGGVYVPLDPEYPRQRLDFIVEDSRARILVIRGEVPENLSPRTSELVDLADFRPEDEGDEAASAAPPPSNVTSANLAYLIYTSGSTGRPKGVAIRHASAVALVRWAGEVYSGEELRGVLASTSVCFDLSVFEVFVPLCHGGRVIVAANALELPEVAREVSLLNTVPSAVGELLRTGGLPVGVVNLAGEPLTRDLVEKIHAGGEVEKLYNLYGPSEDTTYSTFAEIGRGDARAPSIGRPISGTQAYLADRALVLLPQGVPGELLLGGAGLARGYLGRPALTAERFVPDGFSDRSGERLYRTGDLARHRADGDLEFLGRLDHQVKVRGFRIELGEIETVLLGRESVREAVVLAREDEPGDLRLVAYVVPTGGEPDPRLLREALEAALPSYMVPQAWVVLEALPLSPNGKVDRKALPAPDETRVIHDRRFVAPETEVEEMLVQIWSDVLGVEEIGIYDSFFELGGHSLQATRVLARVRELFGVDLPVRSLLEAPTVAGLQESIARVLMEEAGEEAVAEALAEID